MIICNQKFINGTDRIEDLFGFAEASVNALDKQGSPLGTGISKESLRRIALVKLWPFSKKDNSMALDSRSDLPPGVMLASPDDPDPAGAIPADTSPQGSTEHPPATPTEEAPFTLSADMMAPPPPPAASELPSEPSQPAFNAAPDDLGPPDMTPETLPSAPSKPDLNAFFENNNLSLISPSAPETPRFDTPAELSAIDPLPGDPMSAQLLTTSAQPVASDPFSQVRSDSMPLPEALPGHSPQAAPSILDNVEVFELNPPPAMPSATTSDSNILTPLLPPDSLGAEASVDDFLWTPPTSEPAMADAGTTNDTMPEDSSPEDSSMVSDLSLDMSLDATNLESSHHPSLHYGPADLPEENTEFTTDPVYSLGELSETAMPDPLTMEPPALSFNPGNPSNEPSNEDFYDISDLSTPAHADMDWPDAAPPILIPPSAIEPFQLQPEFPELEMSTPLASQGLEEPVLDLDIAPSDSAYTWDTGDTSLLEYADNEESETGYDDITLDLDTLTNGEGLSDISPLPEMEEAPMLGDEDEMDMGAMDIGTDEEINIPADFVSYDLGHYADPDEEPSYIVLDEAPAAEMMASDATNNLVSFPMPESNLESSADEIAFNFDLPETGWEPEPEPDFPTSPPEEEPLVAYYKPEPAGEIVIPKQFAQPRQSANVPTDRPNQKETASPAKTPPDQFDFPLSKAVQKMSMTEAIDDFEQRILLEDSRFIKRSIDDLVNRYFSQSDEEDSAW